VARTSLTREETDKSHSGRTGAPATGPLRHLMSLADCRRIIVFRRGGYMSFGLCLEPEAPHAAVVVSRAGGRTPSVSGAESPTRWDR
jgi:hypothetical protein